MKTILLDNKEIQIDEEDEERILRFKWTAMPDGYFIAITDFVIIKLHRYLLRLQKSDFRCVDHKDLNKSNYQKLNLRPCSFSQNLQNQTKRVLPKATSKFKGVNWRKQRGFWITRITLFYKTVFIYSSGIEEECAYAYNIAALFLFKSFARLNDVIIQNEETKIKIEESVMERLKILKSYNTIS